MVRQIVGFLSAVRMERSKHHTLFKTRSTNKSEKHRPLSLIWVIFKLLERLIKDHLVDFLVKHNLINPSQRGFQKGRSCLTNMVRYLEHVTKWVDEGSLVDITTSATSKITT